MMTFLSRRLTRLRGKGICGLGVGGGTEIAGTCCCLIDVSLCRSNSSIEKWYLESVYKGRVLDKWL